jgi:hypothetical protein
LDVSSDGKSPKVFGLPRPYAGLYSALSYMANRPFYMRNREPGQYTLNSSGSGSDSKKLILTVIFTEKVRKVRKSTETVTVPKKYGIVLKKCETVPKKYGNVLKKCETVPKKYRKI